MQAEILNKPCGRSFFLPLAIIILITAMVYGLAAVGQARLLNLHDFGQYLQPGGMFAAPENIAQHGFQATRCPATTCSGWDGQFYYYLADDPFLQKDTLFHLDGPQYRSQRIGFALFVKMLATLSGQSWVSPAFYFGVSVLLMLTATGLVACFLAQTGLSPYLALLWSVGASPLFAVLFGFTDGMADAFLIVALVALAQKKWLLYLPFMTLAVLARESYALIPAYVGAAAFIGYGYTFIKDRTSFRFWPFAGHMVLQAIPLIAVIGWQFYVREKSQFINHIYALPFHTSSGDLIGAPFLATLDFMTGGKLRPLLPFIASERQPPLEAFRSIGLALFVGLLISSFYVLGKAVRQTALKAWHSATITAYTQTGALVGCLIMTGLYACFGPGMVWAPIGYVKATGFLAFAFFFSYALAPRPMNKALLSFYALSEVFFVFLSWQAWVP